MKKSIIQMAFLFIIFIFSSCSDDKVTNPTVYDFNGGFENPINNFNENEGWTPTILPSMEDFIKFNWETEEKHSGNYSVSIAILPSYPIGDTAYYNWTNLYKPFKINQLYELKGWVKTLNLKQTAFIVIQCWDSANNMIGFFTSQRDYPLIGTNDWAEIKVNFTPPKNTQEVRIRMGIGAPFNRGGKVWFDDISIK